MVVVGESQPLRIQMTFVNYRDGERRGLDVGVTPAILP